MDDDGGGVHLASMDAAGQLPRLQLQRQQPRPRLLRPQRSVAAAAAVGAVDVVAVDGGDKLLIDGGATRQRPQPLPVHAARQHLT